MAHPLNFGSALIDLLLFVYLLDNERRLARKQERPIRRGLVINFAVMSGLALVLVMVSFIPFK